jgi:hypothetical protein
MRCLKNLNAWSGGGWGVFIAPTTKLTVGEVVCRWVRCATGHFSVRQSRHPTVRVLTVSTVGALTSCHTGRSGAPLTPALTSARTVHALFTLLQTTVALLAVAPLGAPDSPVNYSGAALQKPEGEEFESIAPGAPDTVRWHTGQSGAPDQGSLRFLLLLCFEL